MRFEPHLVCLVVLSALVSLVPGCSGSAATHVSGTYVPPMESPRLAVIGVHNMVEHKDLEEMRLGLGLRLLLTDSLYATGHFRTVEEKPEIREQLGLNDQEIWTRRGDYSSDELPAIAKALRADLLAYATVASYGVYTERYQVAIGTRTKDVARIKVEVCLYEEGNGKLMCEAGEGRADYVTEGLFVTPNDDGRLVAKSLIREATQEAVDDAIRRLLKGSS